MKRLIILLALTGLGAFSSSVFAETGLYGGLGVGGSKVSADVDTPFVDDAVPPNPIVVDFDEYDASFKAFAGYRLLDWLAVEGGWYYLGKPDGSSAFVDPSTRVETEIELKGWNADLVAFWRFQDQWEVFGKLGVFFWNSELEVRSKADASGSPSGNPPGANQTLFDDQSGEDIKGGVGINYLHDENLALRGEFEYFDVDETDDVWMLSFSAIWRFN
ncbi:MAG: outer membrane beta-barrel protein [Chromatiales bacterium]|nr:MAG: outer membrane beta-barrel protein [Chromatiales bacterium]